MYYPDDIIEEVRNKNDIVEVIGSYITLQKKGSSYSGLCPFHGEKTPSFHVSAQKQIFHCFGCGEGGNVISFVMKYENFTFQEAIKTLADRAGVALPEVTYSEEVKKKEYKRNRLLEINKEAATFFFYQLRGENGKLGLEYFYGRKLTQQTMKSFGLGYAAQGSYHATKYLKSKGYTDQELIDAGICVYDERFGLHDKFWNRVMFPIQDINHKVVGFGGRVMGDGKPKYLNSPETMIFDKSKNLYGLNFARVSRANNMILCEGYLDVIAMHQAGFTQAIASLGTAFTIGQASLLKRYTDHVILAYDSDGAGVKAALRAIEILREVGLTGKVLNLEPYKDPDEFIQELGTEKMKERIEQAENSFFFMIRILEKDYNFHDPEDKTRFHKEIAKKLCEFQTEIERENYLQAIATKYHIVAENLRKLVRAYAAQTGMESVIEKPRSLQKKQTTQEAHLKVQRVLLTWVADEPAIYNKIKKYIAATDFTDDLYHQVADMLFDDIEQEKYNPAAIISKFEEEETQRKVASLFHTTLEGIESASEREKALKDVVLAVKKNSYEYYTSKMGTDITALQQVIAGKKVLEELANVNI
ncbi:MAG: DNA primase [Lachnospiraceae bacterium]